jgi:hypothetical protein
MITLVFSPQWFNGIDILFESLAVIVTLLIGLTAWRYFRFSGFDRYRYMALSFWALSVSFLAKIATNFVMYYKETVKSSIGPALIKYNLVQKSNFFFQAGYDIHRFLMLLSFLGIYWLVSKSHDQEHKWIMIMMLFIITLFSFNTYFVFHITAALLLFFITLRYRVQSKKKHLNHAYLNFSAFIILLISQIIFAFVLLNSVLYVIAEVMQLLGFIIFLINIITLVFGHGKASHTDRHHF